MPAHRKYDPATVAAAVEHARNAGAPAAARKYRVSQDIIRFNARRRNIRLHRTRHRPNKSYTAELNILHVLFPGVPLPQTAIAAGCGITKERVRQIESEALRKIRNNPELIAKLRDTHH